MNKNGSFFSTKIILTNFSHALTVLSIRVLSIRVLSIRVLLCEAGVVNNRFSYVI